MSGVPPKNTIISCVGFNMTYSYQLIKDFKRIFKQHIHKKGRQLKEKKLSEILAFLDENKIRSYSTEYTSNNWAYAFSLIQKGKSYKIEKICGIIYYLLLEKNSIPQHPYVVHMCEENFMKIEHVRSSCRSISKMRGMEYNFTVGTDKYDDYIKIADYVAAATRKMKYKQLNSYKYYNLIKAHLPKPYISKIFEKK